jgi:hypothetical protein
MNVKLVQKGLNHVVVRSYWRTDACVLVNYVKKIFAKKNNNVAAPRGHAATCKTPRARFGG